MAFSERIAPSAEKLRELPTLAVDTSQNGTETLQQIAKAAGVDYRLELKLETKDYKYWLCTKGIEERRPGVPQSWVVDYVSRESKSPNDDGTFDMVPYGPQETADLQRVDYMNLIKEEIEVLMERCEIEPSPEVLRELESARNELLKLLRNWQ